MKEILLTFKRLKWFFKSNIKSYLLCSLALLFVSIMPVIPTKVLGIAIDDIVMGKGTGNSKKASEQEAAKDALSKQAKVE